MQLEVAAFLLCLPATDPSLLTEKLEKTVQTVVPIVIARHHKQVRRLLVIGHAGQRATVRTDRSIAVLFVTRGWINLVAAHDEQVAALRGNGRSILFARAFALFIETKLIFSQ